jgi:AhpC/TSA antioxidant enzyme
VSDRLAEFSGAAVALITFTRPRNLHGFRRRLGLAYPVLADETRAVYLAYGLRRGSWWRVWGVNSVRGYGRLLRQGRRLERPTGDTLQLGGDFVVDPVGRLAYAYRSRGPDDRPSVDDLLDAVRSCR